VLLGISGGFGNALVSVNSSTLLGSLGFESNEIAWIPTAYSMTYVTMNLILVRFRQQYGLRLFSVLALSSFSAIMALHLAIEGFGSALLIHAAAGCAAAPLTSLSVYYLMSAFPPRKAIGGVVLGLGISQIPTPLARMLSSDLLALEQWKSLYLFEFGLGLICLGSVLLVRLPPSERVQAFEPLDFVSYPIFAFGFALVCAFVGMGRYEWWFDRDWLGWTLAAAIAVLGLGAYIEANRSRPLVNLRWLSTPDIIRFVVVAVVCRIVLAEQSTSVIGLLGVLGQNNDELRFFSLLLVLASAAGAFAALLLVRPNRITSIGALAIALVAVGALIDSGSTNLTRTQDLYLSQMMVAFAATLFIGPAILFGIPFVLRDEAKPLPSFLALFVIIQNLGSLIGSALLGTYEIIREKAISVVLVEQLKAFDPQVAARLRGLGAMFIASTPDDTQRSAQATTILHQQMTREATILAYDDTFRLVALIAILTTIYLLILVVRHLRRGEPLSAAALAAPMRTLA
jgi:MFS family permease